MNDPALTLQDIADIARVQRPVVSAWRTRPTVAGELVPFPHAVTASGRMEYFDRDDVIEWIGRTGRGNNPEFAVDARAAAIPPGATFDQLAAMLTLAVLSETTLFGLEASQLLDLADEADPDDEFLFTEIDGIAGAAATITTYVDALRDLAFGPADAYGRLCNTRVSRTQFTSRFTSDAVDLMTTMVAAIAARKPEAHPCLLDASAGGSRISLDIAAAVSESTGMRLAVNTAAGTDDTATQSLDLRRHKRAGLLRGIPVGDGQQPTIALLPAHNMSPDAAIDVIDELQLSLEADTAAIVVGPASLLCDVIDDPRVESARDNIVRTGKLRFAARLPRGLWTPAPRQALALWVFGEQVARKIEDRTIALADLSQHTLDETTAQELTSDVIGALENVSGRAFRYCRIGRTSRLIAALELVPPGTKSPAATGPSAADRVLHIDTLLATLGSSPPTPDVTVAAAEQAGQPARPSTLSLRTLIDSGRFTLISGTRIDHDTGNAESSAADGSVAVFDPAPTGTPQRFDPIELELRYPQATRTEPGDVVFTHSPQPAARVDENGGNVVAFPARILRPRAPSHLGPHALARAINRLADGGREWPSWPIPIIDPANAAELDRTLAELTQLETELQIRVQACHQLADQLTDAVAAHAVSMQTAERNSWHHA